MATLYGRDVLKKIYWVIWVYVLILMVLLPCRKALYLEGELQTTEKWIFVGRFCFLSDVGRLEFEVEYPKSFEVQNLILYYDTQEQWPSVYPHKDKTCLQKESVLKKENHQVVNLTTDYIWAGCRLLKLGQNEFDSVGAVIYGDTEKYVCEAGRSFRSARERWWYIVLDNCNAEYGLYMKYKMTFTNGDGFWRKHFSADQFGILEADLFFFGLFGVMFLMSILVAYILKERQLFHTTYKMYMWVIVLYMLALLLYIVHYVDYGRNGTANMNTKLAAQIFQALADGVFLLMLILMAKGYNITRGRISHSGSVKIAVLMCLYTMLNVALFVYQQIVFDEGEVLYLFESPAGFGLIAVRGLCWLWFIYAIFFTLKHYPEKGLFYYPFFFFYTIWFLATPVMILIATFVMPKWWREKIMNFIELLIAFTAQVVFLVLTRPSRANTNFPYHVRTSQIGVMNEPNGNISHQVDNFSHHAYGAHILEGGSLGHSPNFTELFTVSGSNANSSNAKPQYLASNGDGDRRPSALNGGMFTASSFIRGGVQTWPTMPTLPHGHLPPISHPPPYGGGSARDVGAFLFANDGDQPGRQSPREVSGLFAPESDGNGSNASSSNSLIRHETTAETTT
ncbi:transmembrane protein 145-like [Amphiura filiformis]|uniref:transmembrane protein 145-like n=1 Tax=Amphiura filiformis TaxID=82378 RepID=UPI003B220F76